LAWLRFGGWHSARDAVALLPAINKLHMLKQPARRFLQLVASQQVNVRYPAIKCEPTHTSRRLVMAHNFIAIAILLAKALVI